MAHKTSHISGMYSLNNVQDVNMMYLNRLCYMAQITLRKGDYLGRFNLIV